MQRDTKGQVMSDETDLIKLYSAKILDLAANIPNSARLDAPMATVKRRAPLCGSTVTVDVRVDNGRISDFAQDVKACALGQAAAAVVGAAVVGRSLEEIEAARSQLRAMLKEGAAPPQTPFDGLAVLEPAREYKNRHASIMLSLDATAEAFEQALQSNCA